MNDESANGRQCDEETRMVVTPLKKRYSMKIQYEKGIEGLDGEGNLKKSTEKYQGKDYEKGQVKITQRVR